MQHKGVSSGGAIYGSCAAADRSIERIHGYSKIPRMVSEVVFDESGDEEIAVVVALLHP
jgi:hypothetical protein